MSLWIYTRVFCNDNAGIAHSDWNILELISIILDTPATARGLQHAVLLYLDLRQRDCNLSIGWSQWDICKIQLAQPWMKTMTKRLLLQISLGQTIIWSMVYRGVWCCWASLQQICKVSVGAISGWSIHGLGRSDWIYPWLLCPEVQMGHLDLISLVRCSFFLMIWWFCIIHHTHNIDMQFWFVVNMQSDCCYQPVINIKRESSAMHQAPPCLLCFAVQVSLHLCVGFWHQCLRGTDVLATVAHVE